MLDRSLNTRAGEQSDPISRRSVAVPLALVLSVGFVIFHAPTVVLRPLHVFDEGLQLASGAFVNKGLVAFRDYYVPYGPANAYLLALLRSVGLDSVEASRVLFLLLNGAVTGLGAYLVVRRTGILAAMVFGGLVFVSPPNSTYAGVVLLVIAAYLTAIGWRQASRCRPLVEAPSASNDTRLLAVGLLLALTVWFRWEFGAVLAVWLVLILLRPGSRGTTNLKLTVVPAAVAAAPYIAIVALGGGRNLFDSIRYALFSYPRFRSFPFPATAPWELVSRSWSNRAIPYDEFVFTVSFFAIGLGVVLLAIGPLADRSERWQSARVFEPDDSRMTVIVGATAALLLLSLRTRPDVDHATQLMVLGWLAILWNRVRYERLGIAVGVLAFSLSMSLLISQARTTNNWAAASSQMETAATVDLPRVEYASVGVNEDRELGLIANAWTEYRSTNPDATDEVFVANRLNSLTYANAPVVYWLLDARPAHWLTTFDPGFADQESHQRRMVEELCESGAALVLREDLGFGYPPEWRFSDALDVFIEANYLVLESTDRYDLLVPAEPSCVVAPTG